MAKNTLIGRRFGRLTVIAEEVPFYDLVVRRQLRVRCNCGQERIVRADRLTSGDTTSCGCYRNDVTAWARRGVTPKNKTHGDTASREYRAWAKMIDRCENPRNDHYGAYGGRGIKICARWRRGEDGKSGYECFLKDVGRKPSPLHSIDRIKVDGDYEPGNVRWATEAQQRVNIRPRRRR